MASGKPVIAYGRGGASKTIISYNLKNKGEEAATSIFFNEQSMVSLLDALEQLNRIEKEFDPAAIRKHTHRWDREIFKEKIKKLFFEKKRSKC